MPKLLKNNAVIDDSWVIVSADETPGPSTGNSLIPLSQWLALDQTQRNDGSCGPWIAPDDDIEACMETLLGAPIIAIEFPTFMDGRGFSLAEILRKEGYQGEIRAIGNLIQDQLFFLKRCGFDAVSVREGTDLEQALASFNDFSVTYQTSADTDAPLFRRR